jgi:hypothetical protein
LSKPFALSDVREIVQHVLQAQQDELLAEPNPPSFP